MKSSKDLENIENLDATKHTKKCTKCGELKSLNEFYKQKRAKDGLQAYCKVCIAKERNEAYKNRPLQQMLTNARNRAKKKGLEFSITEDDIRVPNFCPILGIKLQWGGGHKNKDSSPSLDRINNDKGYTPDNIWMISHRANTIKNNGSAEEHRLIANAMDAILISTQSTRQRELDL